MIFQDEFEETTIDGNTYLFEVEGEDFGDGELSLNSILIYHENGESIEEDSELYNELNHIALDRDYDLEEHNTDNSYYGEHEDLK